MWPIIRLSIYLRRGSRKYWSWGRQQYKISNRGRQFIIIFLWNLRANRGGGGAGCAPLLILACVYYHAKHEQCKCLDSVPNLERSRFWSSGSSSRWQGGYGETVLVEGLSLVRVTHGLRLGFFGGFKHLWKGNLIVWWVSFHGQRGFNRFHVHPFNWFHIPIRERCFQRLLSEFCMVRRWILIFIRCKKMDWSFWIIHKKCYNW